MYNQDKTISFYNRESKQYAKKRYEGELLTYTQYIFRKRMSIFFYFISSILKDYPSGIDSLFDIGCADGSVLFSLNNEFPGLIKRISAVDISEEMIKVAKNKTNDSKFSFYIRGKESDEKHEIVTELGVHISDIEKEMEYVSSRLKSRGYYIYTTGDRNSLFVRLKLRGREGTEFVDDYKSLLYIEKMLGKKFEIIKKVPYGFFVPKLWKIPTLARFLQPLIDGMFSKITPNLFHEAIYLLRLKDISK